MKGKSGNGHVGRPDAAGLFCKTALDIS